MNYWENLLQIESIRKDELDPVEEYVNNKHVTTFTKHSCQEHNHNSLGQPVDEDQKCAYGRNKREYDCVH